MLMYICVILVDKNYLFGYHVISSTFVITVGHLMFQGKYFNKIWGDFRRWGEDQSEGYRLLKYEEKVSMDGSGSEIEFL